MGDKTKWETTTTTTIIDDQICRRLRPAYKKKIFLELLQNAAYNSNKGLVNF